MHGAFQAITICEWLKFLANKRKTFQLIRLTSVDEKNRKSSSLMFHEETLKFDQLHRRDYLYFLDEFMNR